LRFDPYFPSAGVAGLAVIAIALVGPKRHDEEDRGHRNGQDIDTALVEENSEACQQEYQAEEEVRWHGCRHWRFETDAVILFEARRQEPVLLEFVRTSATTRDSLPRIFTAIGTDSFTAVAADRDGLFCPMCVTVHLFLSMSLASETHGRTVKGGGLLRNLCGIFNRQ
jgi:hypothetical protein